MAVEQQKYFNNQMQQMEKKIDEIDEAANQLK